MFMEMEWSYVGAVVISGLVIVFTALLLLILAVWLMGEIFAVIKGEKKKKIKPEDREAPAPVVRVPVVTEPAVQAIPAVTDTESEDEIAAVIAAAVAAMSAESGKAMKIKSIRPARGRVRTNAWAGAAASEATRTF